MYVKQTNQFIGHKCGVHPFQACTPEHAEAQVALPDATGWPMITLHAMQPPVLLPAPLASTSAFPRVPDSCIHLIHVFLSHDMSFAIPCHIHRLFCSIQFTTVLCEGPS